MPKKKDEYLKHTSSLSRAAVRDYFLYQDGNPGFSSSATSGFQRFPELSFGSTSRSLIKVPLIQSNISTFTGGICRRFWAGIHGALKGSAIHRQWLTVLDQ